MRIPNEAGRTAVEFIQAVDRIVAAAKAAEHARDNLARLLRESTVQGQDGERNDA